MKIKDKPLFYCGNLIAVSGYGIIASYSIRISIGVFLAIWGFRCINDSWERGNSEYNR